VFQVLTTLIEHRHRVVTRDELLAHVWPDQCVGEETLTSCVKAARRAVGDSGQRRSA
jgi:DNA-binding winged helix-turn-helix (wHTH) protein